MSLRALSVLSPLTEMSSGLRNAACCAMSPTLLDRHRRVLTVQEAALHAHRSRLVVPHESLRNK